MAAAPYAAPQQVYFGHPAPGQIPPQAAVFGFPQHLVPGMGPGAPVMMLLDLIIHEQDLSLV